MTALEYSQLPHKVKTLIEQTYQGEQQATFESLRQLSKNLEDMGYYFDYDMAGEIVYIKNNPTL